MHLRPQELLRQPLGGERVLCRVSSAGDLDFVHGFRADLELEWLAVLGAADELTSDLVARADLSVRELIKVGEVTRSNNLQGTLATSIVKLNEEEVLTSEARRASPTTNGDQHIKVGLMVVPKRGNSNAVSVREQRLLLSFNRRVTFKCVLDGTVVALVNRGLRGSGGSLSRGASALCLGLGRGRRGRCLFLLNHFVVCR